MNIFATSPDPIESAISLDDKRVGKMTIESAQLISMIHGGPYKFRHAPRPIAEWIKDKTHFSWVIAWHRALGLEFYHRFGKHHLSYTVCGVNLESGEAYKSVTNFLNYTVNREKGIDFTHISDPHEAYRRYMKLRWETDIRPPLWTKRARPLWG